MGKLNVRNRLKSEHEFALMLRVTTEECHFFFFFTVTTNMEGFTRYK